MSHSVTCCACTELECIKGHMAMWDDSSVVQLSGCLHVYMVSKITPTWRANVDPSVIVVTCRQPQRLAGTLAWRQMWRAPESGSTTGAAWIRLHMWNI